MYEKMSQVSIFAPRDNPDLLLSLIWQLNCIHLLDIKNEELEEIHQPDYEKEEMEYRLNSIRELYSFFDNYQEYLIPLEDISVPYYQGEEILLALVDQVGRWKTEMNTIIQKEDVYKQYETILGQFEGLVPELRADSMLEVRGIIIRDPGPHLEEDLRYYLKKELGDLFELELKRISSNLFLGSIIYPREYSTQIKSILDYSNISDLVLPSKLEADTLADKIQQLLYETRAIRLRRAELLDNLQSLYEDYLRLEQYRRFITERYLRSQGISYLRRSENFTIITGYTPTSKKEEINRILQEKFGDMVIIQYDDEVVNTPTKFKNPHMVKEFQIFTEMLPPLRVGTVDPTWLIFMFFPLFYGFIVGDIGYGIIISGIGYYVYLHYREDQTHEGMKRLGWVFFLSGLVTIIFGVIFGEFFGDFGEDLGLHPLWFHRGEDLMLLLITSIVIGVIHVCLGLLLGVYNGNRVGHTKVVYGNGGLLLMYFGTTIFVLATYLDQLSMINQVISLLFVILGLFLVLRSEGFIGIIEALSTIGNMLSYARLMALGAASVILADLANELYYTSGGGVLGLVVAVLLHVLNLGLALFSPTIHSMRLHLVEFFNKFVEYGAAEFKPFGTYEQLQYT